MFELTAIIGFFLSATVLYILADGEFEFLALPAQLALIHCRTVGSPHNQLIFIELSDWFKRLLDSNWQRLSFFAFLDFVLGVLVGVQAGG